MPPPFVIPGHPHRRVVTRQVAGPMGASGPQGATHVHAQTVAADTWTVAHNLGFKPIVTVIDSGFREVQAAVVHLSDTVTQITLVAPLSGYARFA